MKYNHLLLVALTIKLGLAFLCVHEEGRLCRGNAIVVHSRVSYFGGLRLENFSINRTFEVHALSPSAALLEQLQISPSVFGGHTEHVVCILLSNFIIDAFAFLQFNFFDHKF